MEAPPPGTDPVSLLVGVIRRRFGLDFGGQRYPILEEALARRADRIDQAARVLLEAEAPRVSAFVEHLTNGETYFLRHPTQFEAIRTWAARRSAVDRERQLRAWCAGCSTGEEALSLALTLAEVHPVRGRAAFDILATDLSGAVLNRAREARYGPWSFRGVPPGVRDAHFIADGRRFRPTEALRSLVTYQQHNLMQGPPAPGAFDLVLCRNVLIYFDRPSMKRAFEVLARAVRPDGILVLGPAEGAARIPPGFQPEDIGGVIVYRRESGSAPVRGADGAPGRLAGGLPRRTVAAVPRRVDVAPPAEARAPPPSRPPADARPSSPTAPGAPSAGRLELARAAANAGDYPEAAELLERHLERHPDDPDGLLLKSVLALEAGDLEAAAGPLDRALAAEPALAMGHYLLGMLMQAAGQRSAAAGCYREALEQLDGLEETEPVRGGGGLTAGELAGSIGAMLRGGA